MVARVILEVALGRELDYLVPSELEGQIKPGTRVEVPLGRRKAFGLVTEVAKDSPSPNLKPILRVVATPSLVTPTVLRLARWIAEYYCCPPEVAFRSVLPGAVRHPDADWRRRLYVRLTPPQGPLPRLSPRQKEILHVVEERRALPLTELQQLTGANVATIRRLEDKGLVEIVPQIEERDPWAREQILPTTPLTLNEAQSQAVRAIVEALDRLTPRPAAVSDPSPDARPGAPASPGVFLLHGVTGSGKTEVYLQAIAAALERGRGAIVLVPEISLTPQTVERFKARFCTGPLRTLVAVLHSHLSAGERHDEWHKIRQGRARIVIGARSAIFAPVQNPGLIIVDEEHEPTYKQEEAPRYHARDLAVVRGRLEPAVVVLGSATPSLESYHNARQGKYTLLTLPERVDARKMPRVRVVDMRAALRSNRGVTMFSPQLREAILQRLERGEQVILFLNRRGYATALQCPKCGFVAQCPNCSVAFTYHRAGQRLLCHICGESRTVPAACPNPRCGDPAIRYAGMGTQRVEEALLRLFPTARVQRMDSDILQRKEEYRRILGEFRAGKIDILVGTQMIAKGLHFPNVTLVGIVHADLTLHQPDFRAAERTFQLLTQVAGRAGRGDIEGEVIVQSFTPYHPAIQYARRHDFEGFYEQEIEFRSQLRYPPFTRVALLTVRGRNEEKVRFVASHLRRELETHLAGWDDLIMSGPAPAPLERAQSYYRHHLMLRTRRMLQLARELARWLHQVRLPEDVRLTVDVDPVNLL
ncbi:primosomal protein N' [Limisphaera ngatamarikiensis]|uniref:Replication restart protein PriA n=1 Tax=Limisphaera ngatamarikiensis TaxID=1324935 RepID=A0A6M1RL61_9BACT|nr:primosomal protein N' [Limisphaera ngatamarikiensis]NGO40506.1 primosomal protein N' [Limisphaera ngatamarikiensis]